VKFRGSIGGRVRNGRRKKRPSWGGAVGFQKDYRNRQVIDRQTETCLQFKKFWSGNSGMLSVLIWGKVLFALVTGQERKSQRKKVVREDWQNER